MIKMINIIIVSFLFSSVIYDFKLGYVPNNSNSDDDLAFPASNGIIDIESSSNNGGIVWVTTGSGLGKINYSYIEEALPTLSFSGVVSSNLPPGGNPALFVKDSIIIISGVEQEYINNAYEPKGTGIGYSIDSGGSWNYVPQPICEDCERYSYTPWGEQEIEYLSVTTDINNVSYDLGLKDEYIYAASWAGGLRRFDYSNNVPIWEVIPLPMDNQDSLICNSIDEENYLLNPVDPSDGGNHNHKGFSIFGSDEYLWVGTANGINRGTVEGDCINWYHQTTENGLSGNWVVGIEKQITDSVERIWAITWGAGSGEYNSISYTEDYGNNWEDVNYFTSKNIKIYNLDFYEEQIYAASEEGLFYSKDLVHWEKVERFFVDVNTGDIILDETVYSVLSITENGLVNSSSNDHKLFIGTGDGLISRWEGENEVFRFWNNHASSSSENLGFSVYPNPFFINDDGYARFIYYSEGKATINIYDFGMNPVVKIESNININDEDVILWDGRDNNRNTVVNGTYFCKLSSKNNVYWTKIIVIN